MLLSTSCSPLRTIFCSLLLSLVACGGEAHEQIRDREYAVINGKPCDQSEHPSAVALMLKDTDGLTFHCSGTLIHPSVVLTAAHCVHDEDENLSSKSNIYVTRAAETKADGVTAYDVWQVVSHPNYEPMPGVPLHSEEVITLGVDTQNFDVALLVLTEAIEGVQPARLLDEADALQLGITVRVAGWGRDAVEGGSAGTKICATSRIEEIGATKFKVGGKGSPRQCYGDSGGPSYLTLDGQDVVIGVTSHLYDSTLCINGAVSTRIDVFGDWINRTIEPELEVLCHLPKVPSWCSSDSGGCAISPSEDPPAIVWLALLIIGLIAACTNGASFLRRPRAKHPRLRVPDHT